MSYPTSQAYDPSRHVYSTASSYGHYPAHQYGSVQPSPSVKNEMAPPTRAGAENDQAENKVHEAYPGHSDDAEHEGEYTHTSASYGAARRLDTLISDTPAGPVHSDPSHISPEMTHSPQRNGSGRATPRTATTASGYTGYATPQRAAQLPSSNLYNVMSNDARANGPESYPSQQGYQPQQQAHYPSMNGMSSSQKRVRDVDDNEDQYGRPMNSPGGLKRQRTDGSNMGARPTSKPQSVKPVR